VFDRTYRENLEMLLKVIILTSRTPAESLHLRNPVLDNSSFKSGMEKAEQEWNSLMGEKAELEKVFFIDSVEQEYENINEKSKILLASGYLSFLYSEYREAKQFYRKISRLQKNHTSIQMGKELKRLAEYLHAANEFKNNTAHALSMGSLFMGICTPFPQLGSLKKWYDDIRNELGRGFQKQSKLADFVLSLPENRLMDLMALKKDGFDDESLKHIRELFALFGEIDQDNFMSEVERFRTKLQEIMRKTDILGIPKVRKAEEYRNFRSKAQSYFIMS
jgi:hypothetical protein